MEESMGKAWEIASVLILTATLAAGCGVTDMAEKTLVATASGSAAGNAAASSRKVGSRDANDYTSYVVPRHEDHKVFWGQQKEDPDAYKYSMDMDIYELQWVTNEWLYYTTYDETGKEWLYRVPVERSVKMGRPQKNKKEKLCKAQDLDVTYATEDYLVVIRCGDTKYDYELCRFDLDTRRQTVLLGHKEAGGVPDILDDRDGPVWINGNLIVEGAKKLFLLNPDTGESEEIYSWHIGDEDDGIYAYKQIGSSLYFLLGDNLYQYDGITGKVTLLVRKAVFREAVEKATGKKLQDVGIETLFAEKDSLYFMIETEWEERKAGKRTEFDKQELFRAPVRDPQSLRREDELMDYLDKKGEYYLLDEEDEEVGLPMYSYDSSIEDMSDGRIYVQYEGKKDSRFVRYDPETKKIEECSWEEWRWEMENRRENSAD